MWAGGGRAGSKVIVPCDILSTWNQMGWMAGKVGDFTPQLNYINAIQKTSFLFCFLPFASFSFFPTFTFTRKTPQKISNKKECQSSNCHHL
jgi:hypothetical protein